MIQVRWYEKDHLCPRCGTEWTDEWSCTCNDRCPACHLESSPVSFRDLSRELFPEDFQGAEQRRRLVQSDVPHQATCTVTAEQARDYAEARLEGR